MKIKKEKTQKKFIIFVISWLIFFLVVSGLGVKNLIYFYSESNIQSDSVEKIIKKMKKIYFLLYKLV